MNVTTNQILEGALARLQIGWTQIHLAVDAKGKDTFPGDDKAVGWCAIGAVSATCESLGLDFSKRTDRRLYRQALYRVAFNMPTPDGGSAADDDYKHPIDSCVSNWNDDEHHTQEDVVLAFKQALCG